MTPNPLLGVVYHWTGGLAAGSFYVPYKAVRKWSWETYWLVGGVFSWLIAPWVLASIMVPNVVAVLVESPPRAMCWAFFWGAMWGVGGLTFGLSVRYMGMSLGYAVALGYCAVFGTLMPPIFKGTFLAMLSTAKGSIIVGGMLVCVAGIAICGMAGRARDREKSRAGPAEFSFFKGILVATLAGILSASMSYAMTAGDPIGQVAVAKGAPVLWSGLPKLIVILAGGFVTNFVWCVFLNFKNRTGREYFSARLDEAPVEPSSEVGAVATAVAQRTATRVPLVANYAFCAMAGVTWYLQFFFYSMGETQMGAYQFSSWTLHMASIIIFSTLWGIALREWKGASTRTKRLISLGLAVLIASTLVVGLGNYIGK